MNAMKQQQAAKFAAALRENVERWCRSECDYAKFDARQREIWDAAKKAGVDGDVAQAVTPAGAPRC